MGFLVVHGTPYFYSNIQKGSNPAYRYEPISRGVVKAYEKPGIRHGPFTLVNTNSAVFTEVEL